MELFTERLQLREFVAEDWAAVQAYQSNENMASRRVLMKLGMQHERAVVGYRSLWHFRAEMAANVTK